MTVHKVLAVYDRAVEAYNRPFYAPTNQAAIRSFADEVNRAAPDNPMNAHPSDYELLQLGVFDDETGVITPIEPLRIARAEDHIRSA